MVRRFALHARWGAAIAAAVFSGPGALAQLRVATWNVTNYASDATPPSNSRDVAFQTAVYGVVPTGLALSGRSMAPDVLICSEFISATAVNTFRTLLNTAPGSPGDWAAAPFINGPDTDSAFFYRTSRVQLLASTVVASGGGDTCNQPRNTVRFDFRPVGYAAPAASIAAYSVHFKAQGSNADCPAGENAQGRRLLEAQRIRLNAQTLPTGFNFLLAGDTNIQTSGASEYQELIASRADNRGRLFDPIASPGSWNNNSAFRFIHTQEPASQLDDRHDQILVSASLIDRTGLDYIFTPGPSGAPQTFSTGTWNDPNHTYRCWGNDGGSYNGVLRTTGNVMVGPVIAQALITSVAGNGHLPVFADFRVPAKVAASPALAFGQVQQGAAASAPLTVTNAGDVARWTVSGIDTLRYTFTVSGPFTAPPGPFTEPPGGGSGSHLVVMDTTTPGVKSGTLTIASNDPDQPVQVVALSGEVLVVTLCAADFNQDGVVDPDDLSDFVACFFTLPCSGADFNGDGAADPDDLSDFIGAFFTAC